MLENVHTKNVKLISANFESYLLTEHLRLSRTKTVVEVWYSTAIYQNFFCMKTKKLF